jgi:hypothetical protein
MQPPESTQRRLNKRPRANITLLYSFRIRSPIENGSPSSDRCCKRALKPTQLLHFKAYGAEILGANSPNLGSQNEFTPVSIEPQTGKI